MVTKKGAALEELVRAYFARQGFFALRGVSIRFEDEEVTDVDVWLYGRQSASIRTRTIVDIKDKRSPKAFERVLWTRGMQLALGCDRAIVATTDTNPKVARFAQQQKVALLTKGFLERLEKAIDKVERLTLDQFMDNIALYANHKQDGDWLKKISDAKSAVVSMQGYPAFIKSISSFAFFAERAETRPQHKEQALRGAYVTAALACIALDSALERVLYEDSKARFQAIASGVTYGDSGDAKVQNSIDTVLAVIAGGMENGRVVSRQAKLAIDTLFENVRADIIAEYFSREHHSSTLFAVAKELDEKAHSSSRSKLYEMSTEAKSVLGVFADFTRTKRSSLFGVPREEAPSTDTTESNPPTDREQSSQDEDQKTLI